MVVGKAIAGDHGGADLPRPDRHLLIFGQVAAIVLPEDEIRPALKDFVETQSDVTVMLLGEMTEAVNLATINGAPGL